MKILIVGASVAGLEAAFYARKRYPSATIQLLDQSQVLGYHPTRFNRYLIGEFAPMLRMSQIMMLLPKSYWKS